MLHVEIKRELVTDDGKRFSLLSYIAFGIWNKETNHLDRVICRIVGISEPNYKKNNGYIIVDDVEINRGRSNQCVFYFNDMQDINYVYTD